MSETFTVHTDAGHPIIFLVHPAPAGGLTAKAELHSIFVQGDTMSALQSAAAEAVRVHFAPEGDAMTGLEAMAAWLGRRMHGEEWANLDARTKASMLEDARELLGLYDAVRFRKPREPEDWESWQDFLVIYWENGQWCGPFYGPLHDNARQDPAIPVMIAHPLPLPPAPGGGEG